MLPSFLTLAATIQSLKKSVPKGDKKRKKEVSLEIAKLEQALQEKHERELAAARTHDKVYSVPTTPHFIYTLLTP